METNDSERHDAGNSTVRFQGIKLYFNSISLRNCLSLTSAERLRELGEFYNQALPRTEFTTISQDLAPAYKMIKFVKSPETINEYRRPRYRPFSQQYNTPLKSQRNPYSAPLRWKTLRRPTKPRLGAGFLMQKAPLVPFQREAGKDEQHSRYDTYLSLETDFNQALFPSHLQESPITDLGDKQRTTQYFDLEGYLTDYNPTLSKFFQGIDRRTPLQSLSARLKESVDPSRPDTVGFSSPSEAKQTDSFVSDSYRTSKEKSERYNEIVAQGPLETKSHNGKQYVYDSKATSTGNPIKMRDEILHLGNINEINPRKIVLTGHGPFKKVAKYWYMYDPSLVSQNAIKKLFQTSLDDNQTSRNDRYVPYSILYANDPKPHSNRNIMKLLQQDKIRYSDRDETNSYPEDSSLHAGAARNTNKETVPSEYIVNNDESRISEYLNDEDYFFNDNDLLHQQDKKENHESFSTIDSLRNNINFQYVYPYESDTKATGKRMSDDSIQMIIDALSEVNVRSAEDLIHAMNNFLTQNKNVQIYDNYTLTDKDSISFTNDHLEPVKHLSNWYKAKSSLGARTKRRGHEQPTSGLAENPFLSFNHLPKRTRWIRTRYGYWIAPFDSYDGRGPLDSLASVLIG